MAPTLKLRNDLRLSHLLSVRAYDHSCRVEVYVSPETASYQ